MFGLCNKRLFMDYKKMFDFCHCFLLFFFMMAGNNKKKKPIGLTLGKAI